MSRFSTEQKPLVFWCVSIAALLLPLRLGAANGADAYQLPQYFKNYEDFFIFVASDHELDADPATIFKLAVDSEIHYGDWGPTQQRRIAVITPNYYEGGEFLGSNRIRGASNNGLYYIVFPEREQLTLVGVLQGNGYRQASVDGQEAFVSSWHISASDYTETTYVWDGTVFRQTLTERIGERPQE